VIFILDYFFFELTCISTGEDQKQILGFFVNKEDILFFGPFHKSGIINSSIHTLSTNFFL